jgi:tetratricopeptide (TPR) repeat protein
MLRSTLLASLLAACLFVSRPYTSEAQTLTLSLPSHKGAVLLDLSGFKIIQSSAKPAGNELGLRIHDKGSLEALIFIFLTPGQQSQTAASCREGEAKELGTHAGVTQQNQPVEKDNAQSATTLITSPNGHQQLYGFHGLGDQCVSISVYADHGATLDIAKASSFLSRQTYDSAYTPKPTDKFLYAEVLYRSEQYKASVPVYASFLATEGASKDRTMRRAATDNMGMALGMSGEVDEARKVFNDAIQSDPEYPLYYYNLACADAEQGKVTDARLHLQQAYDRKANLIPGEPFPDPTKDDSIRKLKGDENFWRFVQALK